jgi:AbiV family abortive infection protein
VEKLDAGQVWELHDACIENAVDLVREAQILADAGRWARAFELAYFAREETAKADLLTATGHMVLADPESIDWDRFSKQWTCHRIKSREAVFADFLAEEVFGLGKTVDANLDAPQEGNQAAALRAEREAALYVHWDNGVKRPSAAVTEERAREEIRTAERQVAIAREMTGQYRRLTPERARELIAAAK